MRLDGFDERVAPRYFAAGPGSPGFSVADGTLFGEDLLKCLQGDAADQIDQQGTPVWAVTINSLGRKLEDLKDLWNEGKPIRRTFELSNVTASKPVIVEYTTKPSGQSGPAPVRTTASPPTPAQNSPFLDALASHGVAPGLDDTLKQFGAVPVEIRNPDGSLVARTTLGALPVRTPQSVESGNYVIGLDKSQKSDATANVSIDRSGQISLDQLKGLSQLIAKNFEALAHERQAEQTPGIALDSKGSSASNELQTLGPSVGKQTTTIVKVRPFAHPMLDQLSQPLSPDILLLEMSDGATFVSAPEVTKPVLLQFLEPGQPGFNAMLPVGTRLRVSKRSIEIEQSLKVSIDLRDPFTNGLVELRTMKDFSALQEVVIATAHEASLADYAKRFPGAAALIGYALLRAEELDLAQTTAERILQPMAMATEPDRTIIMAERAMRVGGAGYRAAFPLFVEATKKGLPNYSFGLSYLTERLRLFSQTKSSEHWSSNERKAAKDALRGIRPFGIFADHTRVFTAYYGATPDAPGSKLISKSLFEKSSSVSREIIIHT